MKLIMRQLICCFAALLFMYTPAGASTLEDIRGRGVVNCAVEENSPGIAVLSGAARTGIAADLCTVLATAVLGNPGAVSYVTVTATEAFAVLQAEEADVLLVAMPWRMAEEVEQGIMLVVPLLEAPGDGRVFGPVVRQGDDPWFIAVRWVLLALARDMQKPLSPSTIQAGQSLGLHQSWDGVAAISLKEMLERNAEGITAQGFRPVATFFAEAWQ